MTIKTGDTVYHRPSDEEWVVAFVDGDDLAWLGWPPGLARLPDCDLIESCTQEESLRWIKQMANSPSGDHRAQWAKRELARRETEPA